LDSFSGRPVRFDSSVFARRWVIVGTKGYPEIHIRSVFIAVARRRLGAIAAVSFKGFAPDLAPVVRKMAAVALLLEGAEMDVITLVTGVTAVLRPDLEGAVIMAGPTVHGAMLARAGEVGFHPMLENDRSPAPLHMTGLAAPAVTPLVPPLLVIRQMTADTVKRRQFTQARTIVTAFARRDPVLLHKGKAGIKAVVEWHIPPPLRVVAAGARVAQHPPMGVIPVVAGHTLRRQSILIEMAAVTSGAFRFPVSAQKGIIRRQVVPESDGSPVPLGMAALAARAILALVGVVRAVAGDAIPTRRGIALAGVTVGAPRRGVAMFQRKARPVVIEAGDLPVLLDVAALAE
jgi:hypothetical protein